MKKIFNVTCLILLLFFSIACGNKKGSLFSSKIEKDIGVLSIKNQSGFIGSVTAGNTIEYEVLVNASGGLDLANISVSLVTNSPITFKDGAYPGTGGTCGASLISGQVCSIIILFQPIDVGSHLADLNFSYNDSLLVKSFKYTLSADSFPILSFEYGKQYDFGNKFIGSSTDLKIKISNIGRVVADHLMINNMSAPFSYKGGTYPGVSGTCGLSLSPAQSCQVVINYSPTINGKHLQDIVLSYKNNGRSEGNTLNLLAWGFMEASLSFTATEGLNWGLVSNLVENVKTFTITHTGGDVNASLLSISNLSNPFIFAGGTFPGIGGTCTSTLSIGSTCTLNIALMSSLSGTWSNTFNFSYFTGTRSLFVSKTITGQSKFKPEINYSNSGTLDFGVVRRNSTPSLKTVTITYSLGDVPVTLNFPALTAPFSYDASGTCGATLSGGSCTKVIKFAPTADYKPGVILPTLQIAHSETLTGSTVNAPLLSLKGSSDALLSMSSSSQNINLNLGSVVAGVTGEFNIILFNQSGSSASSISLGSIDSPFAFKGGNYPGTGGTCGTTIAAAAAGTNYSYCLIVLTFSPTTEQSYSGALILNLNDGVGITTRNFSLTGSGAPAAILVMESKNYGTTGINSQVPPSSIIKVTNMGSVSATKLSIPSLPAGFSFKGGGAMPGTGGNCFTSTTLAAGASCSLNIYFTPTFAGTYSSNLNLGYNNGAVTTSTSSILSGIAEDNANLYLDKYGDTLSFSTVVVGAFQDLTIKLSNGGSASSTSLLSVSSTSSHFIIQNNPCPSSLVSGESCTLTIRFAPQSGQGSKTGSLQISYDDGFGTKTLIRNLSGTANTPSILSLSPTAYDFGARTINSVYDMTFTLTKSGENTLAVSAVTKIVTGSGFSFKGGAYPGEGGSCPTTSNYSGSCTIVISYNPITRVNYTGQLKVTYNNGLATGVTSTSDLSGSVKGTLSFSSSSFGQIIQTLSTEKIITVTNADTNNATSITTNILSSPYSFKGGAYPGTGGTCGSTLPASGTCSLVVVFAPVSVGTSSTTLSFIYDDGRTSNAQSSLILSGEGIAQAILSISETNPYDFGTTNLNGVISKFFTITNSGGVASRSLSGSFTSPAFSFLDGSFPGTGGSCSTSSLAPGTTCTIALSFSPTMVKTYLESFNLIFNDGIRNQTEIKDIKGTGVVNLKQNFYLSLITKKTFNKDELVHFDSENFYLDNISYDVAGFSQLKLSDINYKAIENRLISIHNNNKPSWISYVAIDGMTNRQIFRVYNLLPRDYLQGISAVNLNEDHNNDGICDILLGIYKLAKNHYELRGFDIISGRNGNILKRYLITNPFFTTNLLPKQHRRQQELKLD